MNGYECVMLRTYYPIEFTTAYLNRAENKEDTNNGIDLAKQYNISVNPIQFGKSLSEYTIDKQNSSIYKGISSIKYCNTKIAEELMELSKNSYDNFIELLNNIKTKKAVDSRQLNILTGLNFFNEFGKNKYLLEIIKLYNLYYNKQQINKKDLEKLGLSEYIIKKYSNKETTSLYKELDTLGLINELCYKIENKSMSVIEQIKFEMEYLEYVTYINSNVSEKFYVVLDFKTYKDKLKPYLLLRNIKTGEELKTKIKQGQLFRENPFKQFSILKVEEFTEQFKSRLVCGEWKKIDELEKILTDYTVVK
jgi:DNA polymerase-3 subunit alpha